MIIRIKNRKGGIVNYLKTGKRKDCKYTRDEKDKVISLTGDLEQVDKLIKYINSEKNYKQAYAHITISFTQEDFEKFYDPKTDSYDLDKMQQLVNEYMKLFLSGYNKNEYTYYAELHYPKIKVDENGNIRLPHIHIVLPLINLISDTKLKPAFFTIKSNDLMQTYIAKKYNLCLPSDSGESGEQKKEKKKKKLTWERRVRRIAMRDLANVKTEEEIIKYFERFVGVELKKVNKRNKSFYQLKSKNKAILLRGKGFEHLEEIANKNRVTGKKYELLLSEKIAKQNKTKSLEQLEKEIQEFIKKREEFIAKRRSKKATRLLEQLKEQEKKEIELPPAPAPQSQQLQEVQRPTNAFENILKEEQEKEQVKQYEIDINEIKNNLDPRAVLNYAVEYYKIDPNIYEITGNKINNITNKQKPKNPLDFLIKEVGMSFKEAVKIAKQLYTIQKTQEQEQTKKSGISW